MTEQQPHDVLETCPAFELRRYPELIVAETEVGAPFDLAGNLALPRLAAESAATTAGAWFRRRNEVAVPVER